MIERAIQNRPGKGLYSGDFHSRILESTAISDRPNPIQANEAILAEARSFATDFASDKLGGVTALFNRIRAGGGAYGISFDLNEVRPDGCFSASEVLERKKGCCLEHTYLFLSICNQAGLNLGETNAVGFSVYTHENSTPAWHACGGLLLDGAVSPRLRHWRFEKDLAFRKFVLEVCGVADRHDLHLLMLDFTYSIFGAQHFNVISMSETEVVTNYLNNSGNTLNLKGGGKDGIVRLEESARLGNLVAISNLACHYAEVGETDRLMEVTDDAKKVINSTAMVERAIACLGMRRIDDAKMAAMRAIQLSRDYLGYYCLGVAFCLESDYVAAEKAFEKAYAFGRAIPNEKKGAESSAVSQVTTNLTEIFISWINTLRLLKNIEGIDRAVDLYLGDSIALGKGRSDHGEKTVKVKRVIGMPDSFVEVSVARALINAYLELKQVGNIERFFDASKNELAGWERNYFSARISNLKGQHHYVVEQIVDFFFSLFSGRDPEEALKAARSLGYKNFTFSKKDHILTFQIDGTNFYVSSVYVPSKSSRVIMDAAYQGKSLFFGDMPVGSQIITYPSRHPEFLEICTNYRKCMELFYMGKPKEAVMQISSAIQIDPNDPQLYVIRAGIYSSMYKLPEAIADYKRASSLDPVDEFPRKELERLDNLRSRLRAWAKRTFSRG